METKIVNIRGREKEAIWVAKQGDWDAHWEVDGEQFDGHHVLWSFSFEPHTYLKESELSGEEWRKGGEIKVFRNGECVLNEFHREPDSAPVRIHRLLQECMGVYWDNVKVGYKLYYRDHPAIVESLIGDGEMILKTEDGKDFPLWAFQKENKEEAENRDWTNTTKVHVTDSNISWWRK